MTRSPGHLRNPNHQVRENVLTERFQAKVDDKVVADSTNVIEVDEDGHPKRYYFPREHVDTTLLSSSDTKSTCPFKGEASYYHLNVGGKVLEDALWSYENPYDEHQALKDHVAFYDDKVPAIKVVKIQ